MMVTFWIAAGGLLCLALAVLLPPLLRRPPVEAAAAATHDNLRILQDHLRQLNADLAAGQLSAEQHQEARAELERRVIEEEASSPAPAGARRRAPRTAVALGLLLPALAVGVYLKLGSPQALQPQALAARVGDDAAAASDIDLAKLNAMVDKLAQRMAEEPQNVEGWTQLGRAFAMLQRFEEARQANLHAMAISPPNAQLLADQADVLAMLQNQSTTGEPDRLIAQALQIDPHNLKALALAGSAAFERRDFNLAARHWAQALQLAPAGSELAHNLEGSLAAARSEAQGATTTPKPPASGTATAQDGAPKSAAAARITGTVQLAPELAARVAPGDTLFIFARAAEGPRMPLAIVRTTAQALPLSFTLDDSSAMSPQARLSQFERVVVSARISKSGDALPRSGDLSGQSAPMGNTMDGVRITIDSVQP